MTSVLSIYPNCSKGGMATVYRTRALAHPEEKHDFLFMNDRGGRAAFDSLPNTEYRIIPKGRFTPALSFITRHFDYDKVRVTSLPEVASQLAEALPDKVTYEFHTSTKSIVEGELKRLDIDAVRNIQTPSRWLTNVVARRLSRAQASKCLTVPNLVDRTTFNDSVPPAVRDLEDGLIPLLWIGRFDKGKNFNDFLRVLSLLPDHYVPIVVVSYETEPDRIARALQEARFYGVVDCMQTHLNLSQEQLARLYTWARLRGGLFLSTSLAESYGYSVAEALACGLPTVAYRVGGIPEIPTYGTSRELISVGDVPGMAAAVERLTAEPDHRV